MRLQEVWIFKVDHSICLSHSRRFHLGSPVILDRRTSERSSSIGRERSEVFSKKQKRRRWFSRQWRWPTYTSLLLSFFFIFIVFFIFISLRLVRLGPLLLLASRKTEPARTKRLGSFPSYTSSPLLCLHHLLLFAGKGVCALFFSVSLILTREPQTPEHSNASFFVSLIPLIPLSLSLAFSLPRFFCTPFHSEFSEFPADRGFFF